MIINFEFNDLDPNEQEFEFTCHGCDITCCLSCLRSCEECGRETCAECMWFCCECRNSYFCEDCGSYCGVCDELNCGECGDGEGDGGGDCEVGSGDS